MPFGSHLPGPLRRFLGAGRIFGRRSRFTEAAWGLPGRRRQCLRWEFRGLSFGVGGFVVVKVLAATVWATVLGSPGGRQRGSRRHGKEPGRPSRVFDAAVGGSASLLTCRCGLLQSSSPLLSGRFGARTFPCHGHTSGCTERLLRGRWTLFVRVRAAAPDSGFGEFAEWV